MKKLIALILALVMALSLTLLAGCGDDDESSGNKKNESSSEAAEEEEEDLDAEKVFDGKWSLTIDYAKVMLADAEDMAEYFDDFELPVTFIYKFNDGEYAVKADEDALDDTLKDFKKVYAKAIEKLIGENYDLEAQTVDEVVAEETGYDTLDEFVDANMEDIKSGVIEAAEKDGEYTIDDNTINLEGDGEYEFKIINSKKFKFTKLIDGDEDIADTLPWTFVKK